MFNSKDVLQPVMAEKIKESQLGSILTREDKPASTHQKFMYLKMNEFKGAKVELVRLLFNGGFVERGIVFYSKKAKAFSKN